MVYESRGVLPQTNAFRFLEQTGLLPKNGEAKNITPCTTSGLRLGFRG
jgi:hypothetical protein